jgi:colanic acid biosynthesis glycosyl transferase WcaI
MNVRTRRIPWVLWLHDLLPEGATATGLLDNGGPALSLARRLERAAYQTADRIVVLSTSFTDNLVAKGVAREKIELIYDPATRVPTSRVGAKRHEGLQILSMGNIGHSQGLTSLVKAFESLPESTEGARLVITGTGVAADEARAEIVDDRVRMLGMVEDAELEAQLSEADVAFVSQQYDGSEFNIPSKLMNFMAYGLPIIAAVNPGGEVARIVREAKAGWVIDSSDPAAFPREVARLSNSHEEVKERAEAARRYADQNFTQRGFAARFDEVLREVASSGRSGQGPVLRRRAPRRPTRVPS